jgi:hypothetical protein
MMSDEIQAATFVRAEKYAKSKRVCLARLRYCRSHTSALVEQNKSKRPKSNTLTRVSPS